MRTLAKLLCIAALVPTVAYADPSPSPSPDKLRDALTEMVTSVTQTMGEGKGFILDQAPDVCKQYLAWEAFTSKAWMWVWVAVSVCCLAIAVLGFWGDAEGAGFWFCCLTLASALFAFSFWVSLKKIEMAPKVYLVDYAKSLVK